MKNSCSSPLHPQAVEGLRLFNQRKYFEAHEALEDAWREETGPIRELYRGILQVAVTYLHITRGNYEGAVKVYGRSLKWLKDWPDICRGIGVEQFRKDAEKVMNQVVMLGRDGIQNFNPALFHEIKWNEQRLWICDRCGTEMYEKNCKVSCPNCGNRFDCSDLNIYFD